MARRLQAFVAAATCVGLLVFIAGGGVSMASQGASPSRSGAASYVSARGSDVVAHHDAVAQAATSAAVAKFLLHAGITYYVFDHYIWKPYKAGKLHGFTHKLKIVEAGVAAVFIYHEAKLMLADVRQSKLLSFLASPITAVIGKFSSLKSEISGGKLKAVSGVNSQLGSIQSQAGHKGIAIKEIAQTP